MSDKEEPYVQMYPLSVVHDGLSNEEVSEDLIKLLALKPSTHVLPARVPLGPVFLLVVNDKLIALDAGEYEENAYVALQLAEVLPGLTVQSQRLQKIFFEGIDNYSVEKVDILSDVGLPAQCVYAHYMPSVHISGYLRLYESFF